MVCDGEVLQSFFDKDEAVVAILISWVLHWYYVDVRDSQTGGSVVKVCNVTAVLIAFTPILASAPILTNDPRTAAPYSLGAVGERLGQRDEQESEEGKTPRSIHLKWFTPQAFRSESKPM